MFVTHVSIFSISTLSNLLQKGRFYEILDYLSFIGLIPGEKYAAK